MSFLSNLALALLGLPTLAGGWLGWQLFRQNGRLLLRLEEIEQRLNELEFGELDGHSSKEALDSRSEAGSQKSEADQGLATSATMNGNGDARVARFRNRSLARSKIKRDGLKAGTPAPASRLLLMDGRGELSLKELRGRRVLLVFSDPHCGPCNALAPELEKFHRDQAKREVGRATPYAPQRDGMFQNGAQGTDAPYPISVVMISKGEPKENRAKVTEHGLTFPVVLQRQWEISRRYAMFATPVAYLIDEAGVIVKDVAVGTDSILELMGRSEALAGGRLEMG